MFIQHINRCSEIYYLYQGITKTGNPKYFFSRKVKDGRLDNIPDGFEIYENPDAQVFLIRKVRPLITENEKQFVISAIKNNQDIEYFIIDVKKNIITIYTANDELAATGDFYFLPFNRVNIQKYLNYMKEMRFVLVDEETRSFIVERFCYRGSIDDWIGIGGPAQLSQIATTFVDSIGKESMDIPF